MTSSVIDGVGVGVGASTLHPSATQRSASIAEHIGWILSLTELSRGRYSLGNMSEIAVAEAARRLRLHPTRVRALLRAGELVGRKFGAQWLVDEASAKRRSASAGAE